MICRISGPLWVRVSISPILLECLLFNTSDTSVDYGVNPTDLSLIIKMSLEYQVLALTLISRFFLLLRNRACPVGYCMLETVVCEARTTGVTVEELFVNVGYSLSCLLITHACLAVLLIQWVQTVNYSVFKNIFHIRFYHIRLLCALAILLNPKVFRRRFIVVAEYSKYLSDLIFRASINIEVFFDFALFSNFLGPLIIFLILCMIFILLTWSTWAIRALLITLRAAFTRIYCKLSSLDLEWIDHLLKLGLILFLSDGIELDYGGTWCTYLNQKRGCVANCWVPVLIWKLVEALP